MRNGRNDEDEKWNAQNVNDTEWALSMQYWMRYSCHLQTANVNWPDALWVLSHEMIAHWRTFNIVFEKIKKNWLWFTHSHFFLSLIDVSQTAGPPLPSPLPHTIASLVIAHRIRFHAYLLVSVSASVAAKEPNVQQVKIINVVLCYALSINIAICSWCDKNQRKIMCWPKIDTRHTKRKWFFVGVKCEVWTHERARAPRFYESTYELNSSHCLATNGQDLMEWFLPRTIRYAHCIFSKSQQLNTDITH